MNWTRFRAICIPTPRYGFYLAQAGILPTIGSVSSNALRGGKPRSSADKEYALSVPSNFLAMFIGVLDGDGYISITKAHAKESISICLVLAVQGEDRAMLEYFKSVLRIGTINYYPATNTVKYIIYRTDLQEILFPLMLHHNMFFLTHIRQLQFNKAMYILLHSVNKYTMIPQEVPYVS